MSFLIEKSFDFLLEKSFDFLVSTVGQNVVDIWRDQSHIDNHLDDLRGAVRKGHDIIMRSECWRTKHNTISELLPCLKDAVYEAESIVDELEYQRSKQNAEKSWAGETLANYFKKWMSGFPERVKEVKNNLSRFCNEMEEACNKEKIPENHNQFDKDARPTTTKYVNAPKVYGRDKKLNEVLHLLGTTRSRSRSSAIKRKRKHNSSNFETGESSSSLRKKGNVSLIPIVGMGGVGKTTFAQLIYNDPRVTSYFKKLIWICISDNFDVEWLMKEIIERATKRKCDHTTFNTLQETLEETLKLERFLLVLDDAWIEKETDWKDLLDPIREGIEGSTIFVTTRSKKVAEMAGKGMNFVGLIYLEGLETKIYWEFFKSQAFGSEVETKCYPELEEIGKEICEKLRGSPLAAITIGGLLKIRLDVRHWSTIRDSEMWRLKQEEHHVLPVLRLSYQYLPAHLKKCFSFCSLYPKDFKFTKVELSKLWIMHGFIKCPENRQHEQDILAEVYFNELVSRCFFQKPAESHSDEYVIHDLMHDVCQFMTEDECFCLEDGIFAYKKPISPNVRHLSICQKKLHWDEQNELGKLLSLRMVYPRSGYIKAFEIWCNKLTNVRSLSLVRCKISKLPKNIGNLKHLKYLDVSFSTIIYLPESFCNLYNLKYLNMEGCSNGRYDRFPVGSEKLVSMQFFYFPKSGMLMDGISINLAKTIMVKDLILVLTPGDNQLQVFKYINIRGSLQINSLNNVESKDAAQEAQLDKKPLINSLSLNWIPEYGATKCNHEDVLQGLCPNSNLVELIINSYGGEKLSASWLKGKFLSNLTKIQLENCVNLLTISHVPCRIIEFTISSCNRLTNLGNCLRPEHLPALKCLHVSWCEELMSLPVEIFGRFESLEDLTISYCPKLTRSNAMVLPPTLKYLCLRSCGDLEKSIPTCLRNLSSLEKLTLDNLLKQI